MEAQAIQYGRDNQAKGTIGQITNAGAIGTPTSSNSAATGTGAIENAGLINNIDNENDGVIGGKGDSYGIDNSSER